MRRTSQFIFHRIETGEKVRGRFGTQHQVGSCRFADKLLEAGRSAVERRTKWKSFVLGQDLVQFGGAARWRFPAKDVERDGAERKHVGHGVSAPRIENRFGRQ